MDKRTMVATVAALGVLLIFAGVLMAQRRNVELKDAQWQKSLLKGTPVLSSEDIARINDGNYAEILYIQNVGSLQMLTSMIYMGALEQRITQPGRIIIAKEPCILAVSKPIKEIKGGIPCKWADMGIKALPAPVLEKIQLVVEKDPAIIYADRNGNIEVVTLDNRGVMHAYGSFANRLWRYS